MRALFGAFQREDLALTHRETGEPLERYMRSVGADVEAIGAGEASINPADIACYFELHIEQGPVMVARDVAVGVVTGIRGNYRHAGVTCVGEGRAFRSGAKVAQA